MVVLVTFLAALVLDSLEVLDPPNAGAAVNAVGALGSAYIPAFPVKFSCFVPLRVGREVAPSTLVTYLTRSPSSKDSRPVINRTSLVVPRGSEGAGILFVVRCSSFA